MPNFLLIPLPTKLSLPHVSLTSRMLHYYPVNWTYSEKGRKYTITPVDKCENLRTLIISDLAVGLRCDSRLNTNKVKQLIESTVSSISVPPPLETRTFFNLQKRLRHQNLVIAKADKGESLVILSRSDYDKKMIEFLNTAGAKPIKFSLDAYKERVWNAMKKASMVISVDRDRLKQMCAAVPRLYGQIKLHKIGYPIRPVVSYFRDTTFLVAKYLATWFREIPGFNPRYTIKNSIEFANDLKQKTFPPGSRLISFDVISMFTHIPVLYTIEIMVSRLRKKNVHPEIIKEFKNLITICLKDNICFYQGRTYRFPDGLPIEGPSPTLVADTFMDDLENQFLTSGPETDHILYYARYVDDIS